MPGAWITERIGGSFGAVTRFVPCGHSAYVRLFHPATDASGARVSWTEVARRMGRQAHPLMQWHSLVDADPLTGAGSRWPGANPTLGNLDHDLLAALYEKIAAQPDSGHDCHVGVWNGWGGLDQTPFDDGLIKLPGREYLHVELPLERALSLGRSPNLLWPQDRAWFVASEIDLDSTLVGGSLALVAAIERHPLLEAMRVSPDDSLAADGDEING